MVMPLSRYLAGDFVTPLMRESWDAGTPYFIIGPDGPREMPRDTPFGGPNAPSERLRFVPMVTEDVRGAAGGPWDEGSAAEACFHRPDARSYAALLERCERPPARLFGLAKGAPLRHVSASLFFPGDFAEPYTLESPFPDRTIGSAGRALVELQQTSWPDESREAADTLRAALEDAVRLRLPMIVDS